MARSSNRFVRACLGLTLLLASCADSGLVGTVCDRTCATAPCASGLTPCGACQSDRDCAAQGGPPVCDTDQLTCVECTGSSQCGRGEECRGGSCQPDDDDDTDEDDASDE